MFIIIEVRRNTSSNMVQRRVPHKVQIGMKYEDRRLIGAVEVMWRLLEFYISKRYPALYALRVLLPSQQMANFQKGKKERVIEKDGARTSELTQLLAHNPNNPAIRVP